MPSADKWLAGTQNMLILQAADPEKVLGFSEISQVILGKYKYCPICEYILLRHTTLSFLLHSTYVAISNPRLSHLSLQYLLRNRISPAQTSSSVIGMARTTGERPKLRHLSASFNNADLHSSALRLIFALFPIWEQEEGEIKFTRFTDGITNTVSQSGFMIWLKLELMPIASQSYQA